MCKWSMKLSLIVAMCDLPFENNCSWQTPFAIHSHFHCVPYSAQNCICHFFYIFSKCHEVYARHALATPLAFILSPW